ncbi:MAG: hypothetical protein M0P12_03350 [Paludibacteraceae bacterium]|nr:hypothetical protein [Paludibacteraceae bacterium]MCK9616001.1 hypothetical protein [Candidatus Omnitrophota bacterium]
METWIKIEDCKHGGVYEVDARNFSLAAYNSEIKSFIGIRYKFGSTFLDEEEHWDIGAPHGTVKPIRFIQMLPEGLPPVEIIKKEDSRTGEEIRYIKGEGTIGSYVDKNGEVVDFKYVKHVANTALFNFLKNFKP